MDGNAMEPVLFGLKNHGDTSKAITMLSDAKVHHIYRDLGYAESAMSAALETLSGGSKLPVLIHKGVTYVGIESIRGYCGSGL